MEYLNRILQQLDYNKKFKYHSKCKKLKIVNLSFADDLLLFSRGDVDSVQQVMRAFHTFSQSTKCKTYFGNVEDHVKRDILKATSFVEGPLPFTCLGIPLSSKKLSVQNCITLVDKVVCRIRHWSSRLLSFARRIQLIKSVLFSISNFWLQCLPIPKAVIGRVEAICRSFLWSGTDTITRKSPVSWQKVCTPKNRGGLNIIALYNWNRACLTRHIWNLSGKDDSLWIHSYYIKGRDIMHVQMKKTSSWIMKSLLKARDAVRDMQEWQRMMQHGKYTARRMYFALCEAVQDVMWKRIMFNNYARPYVINMLNHNTCHFCQEVETQSHLLFECQAMRIIWYKVLTWMGINRSPGNWENEFNGMLGECGKKGVKSKILVCAFTKSVHEGWKYCNQMVFGEAVEVQKVVSKIIDTVVYRCWPKVKLRPHISNLLMV
ncbi:uncharacterized protein LOC131657447 [Vicia villosa]|uniref:uncharacterized protein LOC131657447 n=1 Tax=Vicia villosa TaxID=3911 RepID=UPI00273B4AF0|nr:uncharacterized protein LOC131657447 [Vicia villosa]